MPTPFRGYDRLRTLVGFVCRILTRHAGLIGAVTADYPTVGAALTALTAACAATGFDKVPEIP